MAAAHKLKAEGVPFVVSHQCSGAALPASTIYEDVGIILISPAATNPRLTERGLRNTFRTCGRDDLQGAMVADYLANEWAGAEIAIVHDGQAYGQGSPRRPSAGSISSVAPPRCWSRCSPDRPSSPI